VAEGIETPEGVSLDLDAAAKADQDFARAMSTPPDSDQKAPPKRADKAARASDAADKPRVARSPGRPSKAAAAAPGLSHEDRAKGMAGFTQLGAGLLALAGRAKQSVALKADAITVASNADEIGKAVADTADQDERFAAVVDKLCSAGPYAALISVMVGVGSQCARNHGLDIPGTVPPEKLLEMAEAQTEMPVAA
jgi:hypothetical protein